MVHLLNWWCCDRDGRRDDEVDCLKGLIHVCDHSGSDPLGLNKLLSFEALGDPQGDADVGSHLAFQTGRLQGLHLTGSCFAAKGVHVGDAGCI